MKWKLNLKIPWIGELEVSPDKTQQLAAWSLYVELMTRVAIQPLADGEGLLRDALSSLHSLFESTRATLREAGPAVGAAPNTVGGIAIRVLNRGLRPMLSKWHPILTDYEALPRDVGVSSSENEARWPRAAELRQELVRVQANLIHYAHALGVIAGVEEQKESSADVTTF